jgi:hypothetical protein
MRESYATEWLRLAAKSPSLSAEKDLVAACPSPTIALAQ